jgi:type II secretory pathway pseudopilin PulG
MSRIRIDGRRPLSMLRARGHRRGEDGFALLESLITITLITIIMTALGAFFLSTMGNAAKQRAQQGATQVATSAVATLRSLPSSNLTDGRGSTAAQNQLSNALANAPTSVSSWLTNMDAAYDINASPSVGASATVPTGPLATQTINNVAYTTNEYLGKCWILDGSSTCTNTSSAKAGQPYLRLVVAVTWTNNQQCASTCSYVTATLISAATDPVFNINQTLPPAPVVIDPGSQNSFAVGDNVSLQMGVTDGTGVPIFTWAVTGGSLPAGLSMNTSGLISGVPTATTSSQSVTVTVTDAFLRTDSQTFTWSVLPALVATNPGPQASVTGSPITTLSISATGGAGTPYTWSDPNGSIPPGLSLATVSNKASITGTPTTPGNYTVTLSVTDKTGSRKASVTFTWTIAYPPLAASNPGTQVATLNTSIGTLQLSASGGSGNYRWTVVSGLPAGLSMTTGGLITGSPTTLGSSSTSLQVTDTTTGNTQTVTFTWSVVAKPTITKPSPSNVSVGGTVNLTVASTCPNGPCTYSMSGAPSGLVINSSGTISGTVSGSTGTVSTTVTVTDSDGATASTGAFGWTVVAAPTVVSPGNQSDTNGSAPSVAVNSSCALGGCTYTLNGTAPNGLAINASTGVISGTLAATVKTYTGLSVTVRDSAGSTATTATFTWTVYAPPTITSPGNLTASTNATPTKALAYTCPFAPCTFTITGGPSGLGIDSTGSWTGTTGSTATYNTVQLKITDNDGVAVNASATFKLTVSGTLTIGSLTAQSVARGATATSQQIAYTCPTSCTIAISGVPTGIGLDTNNSGAVSTSLSGSSGSSTFWVRGTVDSAATRTTYPITVTITDTTTALTRVFTTATWTVT